MPELKVKCPAKINLTLEIVNKREDGFHNIKSVMQTIDLYDYLTINIEEDSKISINLSGNSDEIPYNEKNLVYKAAQLFFEKTKISKQKLSIYIDKNIPVAAGLAGGSTDAAGTLWGLNKIFDNILSDAELNELCAKLGSDLNFCLTGGCQLATSRGEILEQLPYNEFNVTLIKPKKLGISAKEAYTKYAELKEKPKFNKTEKLINILKDKNCLNIEENISTCLYNDLETAVYNDYKELKEIKKAYPTSIMSGSGSTYFTIGNSEKVELDDSFWFKNNIKTTPLGIC